MTTCSKCGTKENLTRHHVIPKCMWRSPRNRTTVCLCSACHYAAERMIEAIESHAGDVPLGTRYRLTDAEYFRIARRFLKTSTIITVDFA